MTQMSGWAPSARIFGPLCLILTLALAATLTVGHWRGTVADTEREAALAEAGRLRAQVEASDAEAREAKRVATEAGVAAMLAQARADSVTRAARQAQHDARRRAMAAAQTATDAEGRLRATLGAVGLPTADVDSVRDARERTAEAHADEVEALTQERDAQEARSAASETYAAGLVRALETSEGHVANLRALNANTEALWRAAESEARRARREAKVFRVVATLELGVIACLKLCG